MVSSESRGTDAQVHGSTLDRATRYHARPHYCECQAEGEIRMAAAVPHISRGLQKYVGAGFGIAVNPTSFETRNLNPQSKFSMAGVGKLLKQAQKMQRGIE